MAKRIGISIISEIDDLIEAVNYFAENMTGEDCIELKHIHNALNEWEEKNISFLNMDECFRFGQLKQRVENLMNEFQMTT
ncbi:MAG: hypothetical protein Q7W13_13180 [Bacteroidia bacterium]|nr:hypothetical protein [Bacteroidia bacterium]